MSYWCSNEWCLASLPSAKPWCCWCYYGRSPIVLKQEDKCYWELKRILYCFPTDWFRPVGEIQCGWFLWECSDGGWSLKYIIIYITREPKHSIGRWRGKWGSFVFSSTFPFLKIGKLLLMGTSALFSFFSSPRSTSCSKGLNLTNSAKSICWTMDLIGDIVYN